MTNKHKVGDVVWVKYDIEQPGLIEKIEQRWSGPVYHIRVHQGDYVNHRDVGEVVEFFEDDLF